MSEPKIINLAHLSQDEILRLAQIGAVHEQARALRMWKNPVPDDLASLAAHVAEGRARLVIDEDTGSPYLADPASALGWIVSLACLQADFGDRIADQFMTQRSREAFAVHAAASVPEGRG